MVGWLDKLMCVPPRDSVAGASAPQTRTRRVAGFTLIEMMVAMSILAFSLATLMGNQALTLQQLQLADQMNIASMLVRGKMLDLEALLAEEGFSISVTTERGDFDDEGYPDYSWEAEIEPVEISEDAEESFVGNINSELFGEGLTGEGSLSGSAAVSQFLPMIIGQVPQFINQVGERTRKITLMVMWESRLGPQTLTVTQYVVVLELPDQGTGIDAEAIEALGQQLGQQLGGSNGETE